MQTLEATIRTITNYTDRYGHYDTDFTIIPIGDKNRLVIRSKYTGLNENGEITAKENKIEGGLELLGLNPDEYPLVCSFTLQDYFDTGLNLCVRQLHKSKIILVEYKNLTIFLPRDDL